MATGMCFICNGCEKSIESWDEGNPYYFDKSGKKQYAYHPNPNREFCIGIDSPHLCLSCGHEFMVDSAAPIESCPKCNAREIADTWELEGKACPYCKRGIFEDSGYLAVS